MKETRSQARSLDRKHGVSINWLNLLVAVRTDVVNKLPPAHVYLSQFVKSGWTIESLVILGYDDRQHSLYHAFGAPTYELYDASGMAQRSLEPNWLAGRVRNHVGWA